MPNSSANWKAAVSFGRVYYLLGFSLRSALFVKAGAKRRDNGDKILKQVFLAISRLLPLVVLTRRLDPDLGAPGI
jgi:hypothetical protein